MIERTNIIEEEITLPPLRIYDQERLGNKINQYLAELNRSTWNSQGFCHGMAIVWQQKMAEYREQEFYAVVKKIIHYPRDRLKALDDEVDVQKFIAQVEYAQNPDLHSFGRYIKQVDVDKIMETPAKVNFKNKWMSIKSFAILLDQEVKSRASITVWSRASLHSVGIYFRDDMFYLYDANYCTGEAKAFTSSLAVANEMAHRLYSNFKMTLPQWTQDLGAVALNPVTTTFKNVSPTISHSKVTLFSTIDLSINHTLHMEEEETVELKLR